ncbi:mucosa-associated lymphoid tissue lymphoma translocation protein 1, partial [Clarias magur]
MALSNVLKSLAGVNGHLFRSNARLCVCALGNSSVQIRGYAKKPAAKGKGKGMVKEVLKGPEVCKDPVRLTTHAVGVNIYKQGEDPQLKPNEEYPACEKEITSCSLQVLSPRGSPGRRLLALLADKKCSLDFLLQCLKKIEHHGAASFLTECVVPIEIMTNPQNVQAPKGSTITLSCRAVGPPGLSYQWFRRKEEVPGGNASDLILSPAQEGHYICRVSAGERFVFSGWAQVRLLRSPDSGSEVNFPSSISGMCITQQPRAQKLSEGDTLHLVCAAQAMPPPQFQWYHNRKPLLKANRQFLK